MKVTELIKVLQNMPQDYEVEMEVPSGYEFADGTVGNVTLDENMKCITLTC